jgi:hypothetical protein
MWVHSVVKWCPRPRVHGLSIFVQQFMDKCVLNIPHVTPHYTPPALGLFMTTDRLDRHATRLPTTPHYDPLDHDFVAGQELHDRADVQFIPIDPAVLNCWILYVPLNNQSVGL